MTKETLKGLLRDIANRAGSPTMHYAPAIEREEQRNSLNWIAGKITEALAMLAEADSGAGALTIDKLRKILRKHGGATYNLVDDSWYELIVSDINALRVGRATWKCKAQPSADPPQDCDWPTCGCDPCADKVIEALQESGKLAALRAPVSADSGAVQLLIDHRYNIISMDCKCGLKFRSASSFEKDHYETWAKHIADLRAPASADSGAGTARTELADGILKRIAERYKNCTVRIYPDFPELTPVEGVLRCAAEEGFILTTALRAPASADSGALERALKRIRDWDDECSCECGNDPDCCNKVLEFCAHCIANTALRAPASADTATTVGGTK